MSEVDLRHNRLQEVLYERLTLRHGEDDVGTENSSSSGGIIDVVVRDNGAYVYYEIKTADSPRECLRAALGQLLEYAYWSPSPQHEVVRLVVVGEAPLDDDGKRYLTLLQDRFRLPIEYEAVYC